jgi:uncharacterized membrane protein YhaH (DUF805 family)
MCGGGDMTRAYTPWQVRRFVMLSILLFGIATETALYFGFPEYCTRYTVFIPVYFLLLGLSLLFALSRMQARRLHPGRALARLMILNVSQLFLSAVILFVYIRCIDVQRNTFLIVFGLFYVWFLGLKMFVLCNIDRHHQERKKTGGHTRKK